LTATAGLWDNTVPIFDGFAAGRERPHETEKTAGCASTTSRRFMIEWSKVFADALPYASFLDRYASSSQRARWDAMHGRFSLTAEQKKVLGGFARRMPVLCLTGAWCGDCIN
jgi:hypothetical protein